MAKKQEKQEVQPSTNVQAIDYSKFNKSLEKTLKNDTKDITAIPFTLFGENTEFISTGNHLLNAQFSGSLFGGIPNARSVEIAGESGSGKSFICLNLAREANKLGYFIYYVDTEGAMEEGDLTKFGAIPGMFQYIRTVKTFSQVKRFVNEIILQKKQPEFKDFKILIILDSFGHILTDKELEDLAKGKNAADMGLRAKEGRQLFKLITLELSNNTIPFIFTNHTSAKIDFFGGTSISGGGGPTYAASIILKLQKYALKEGTGDEKTKTGIRVISSTEKNRLAKPLNIEFHISFEKGMNPYVGLQDYVNWESCGVQRGKLYTEEEYQKEVSRNNQEAQKLKSRRAEKFVHNKINYVAVLYDTADNYIIKSEGTMVDRKYFFTDKIFTNEVLQLLDENIIKPTFRYSDISKILEDEFEDLESFEKHDTQTDDDTNLL